MYQAYFPCNQKYLMSYYQTKEELMTCLTNEDIIKYCVKRQKMLYRDLEELDTFLENDKQATDIAIPGEAKIYTKLSLILLNAFFFKIVESKEDLLYIIQNEIEPFEMEIAQVQITESSKFLSQELLAIKSFIINDNN